MVDPIRSIAIVCKQGCRRAAELGSYLHDHVGRVAAPKSVRLLRDGRQAGGADLIVSVGGDGTLLRAAAAAAASTRRPSPLFLPVAGGASLGFMLPFSPADAAELLARLLRSRSAARHVPVLERMRLSVELVGRSGSRTGPPSLRRPALALNEVNIHRGASPSLAHLQCIVDGTPLTCAISDG